MKETQAIETFDEARGILCDPHTVVLDDGICSLMGNRYRIASWILDALVLSGDAFMRAKTALDNFVKPK